MSDKVTSISDKPIRILLLDDLEDHLLLSATILRRNGYDVQTSSTIEEAESKIHDIDIAVLDYHLGAGKFGTEVADTLRQKRPEVPIIIMSATLERRFGGIGQRIGDCAMESTAICRNFGNNDRHSRAGSMVDRKYQYRFGVRG